MSKMKIRKGDEVKVIAGKYKGTEGKVLSVDVDNNRVKVEGVAMRTKHMKPNADNQNGGIVTQEDYIDASNVMVVCPVCGKATRVAHTEIEGKKVRSCKKCGASLDKEFAGYGGNIDGAKQVGNLVAKKALEKGIKAVVFDRGGYIYHGRVAALAEGAREGGLEF